MFIKRLQFNYEQEVRIIVKEENIGNVIKFPFDPNILFEEIILDPFISVSNFAQKKKAIEKAGYIGSILHSNLYAKPSFIFKIQ